MSALELKPCPFCGTSLEDDTHPGSTVEGGGFTFECGKCGANWPRMTREAMDGLDDEGIASFFNSRADLPPGYVILSPDEVSQIAELKAELDLLQDILDSRPAINAALPDSYIRWSQAIYSGEAIRSLKGGRDAQ